MLSIATRDMGFRSLIALAAAALIPVVAAAELCAVGYGIALLVRIVP